MAFDAFIKIENVPGESVEEKHKDWIEISSYSFGVSQPHLASSSGATGTVEPPTFQDFTIAKEIDKSSPKLFLMCATGQRIPEVTIQFQAKDRDRSGYLHIKLQEVLVSSYRPGGSGAGSSDLPMEEISFNYAKIEMSYTPRAKADAATASPIIATYDLKTAKGA